MGTYEDIKAELESCICCLEEERFSEGALKDIQTAVCNLAGMVSDLNDYAKSIDDRVTILEGDEQVI